MNTKVPNNFTFRIDAKDSDWLGEYAKKHETSKGGVLREIVIALREGIQHTKLKFKGYRQVPIEGDKVVVVPVDRDLQTSLTNALKTVKVLGLK